jgi:hypothetical protein
MSRYYINGMKCPTCNGKMIMYYAPYCPSCIPKAKVKKNLIQSISYIEHKYDIETRDYAAPKKESSTGCNVKREFAWKDKFAPIPKKYTTKPLKGYQFNAKGMEWYKTREAQDFFDKRNKAYENAPDGKAKEIPYLDWWHHFCDCYDFTNDCSITINWKDVYEQCTEDWQREITQLFIDEFGKRDIKVEISW